MRQTMGRDGLALVGIDLHKDPTLIEAAYNDAQGRLRPRRVPPSRPLQHRAAAHRDRPGQPARAGRAP
ncbi:hypothetical protein G6F59_018709 [Rhizopus arrhizus]|nr:hypothetical protein G6F59_018709 [Rhizopus arrhizus]